MYLCTKVLYLFYIDGDLNSKHVIKNIDQKRDRGFGLIHDKVFSSPIFFPVQ